VIVGANGQCGPDAVPLYEAGVPKISCVIEMEALGQLTVSRASTGGGANCGGGGAGYKCLNLYGGVVKKGIQAQSGQAYIVGQSIHIGRCA
jgi:hypothetical protein